LYRRLYHRPMSREDSLSSRFDYLFEPLDDEVPLDDVLDAKPGGELLGGGGLL
jgi:hypothetical protein